MKKKIIPVVIAMLLILVIGGAAVGKMVYDKYSYSKERVDLAEFYQVSGEESAIILQDEMVEEKAIIKDGICYFDLDTVHKYLNEIFYVDLPENLLLYTTAVENIRVKLGGTAYSASEGETDTGYVIAYAEGEKVYVAAEFVKQYTNFSYEMYDRHVQVYTEWGVCMAAQIKKKTAVREKGGIKSPVLRDLEAGETVEILEQMDTWCKVKTSDSIIGYVENKRLDEGQAQQETPVTDYAAPEYTSLLMNKKVNMGFHAIGAVAGNSTLEDMVAESRGMNVISPTWFSLNDNEGNFRNFGTKDYVDRAHGKGIQVWGALDNFNYKNETGEAVDTLTVLSSTTKRQHLVNQISNTALELGMDGINIDFEGLEEACGIHYVQFLRELSVQCRANKLVLSVDNYVPFHFNNYYRLDVQGEILDYVIIMGYDEHWHGSKEPGSVASIDYVSGGLDKTLEQVPAEKVINALPFYTIEWRVEGVNVTDKYLTLNNTAEYLKRIGVEKVWDETTCQNYVEWKDGSATYQIWLEDEASIRAKLQVMMVRNIAGVAVWRLGYGTENAWKLLEVYSST